MAAWNHRDLRALQVSLQGEEEPRRPEPEETPGLSARTGPTREGRARAPSLLLLLAVLLLTLLAVAAFLVWRSLGDDLSGTSVARDSIDSGPEPRVRLTNATGQVRVEGVEDLESIEYEVTRYALAGDPAAAKRRASEVPVDLSREDSTVVLETGGAGAPGRTTCSRCRPAVPSRSTPGLGTSRSPASLAT